MSKIRSITLILCLRSEVSPSFYVQDQKYHPHSMSKIRSITLILCPRSEVSPSFYVHHPHSMSKIRSITLILCLRLKVLPSFWFINRNSPANTYPTQPGICLPMISEDIRNTSLSSQQTLILYKCRHKFLSNSQVVKLPCLRTDQPH